MIKKILIAMQIVTLCQFSSAFADNDQDADDPDDYIPRQAAPIRPVTSIEAFSGLGEQTTNSLGLAAEYATEQGNYEQAIKLCERALGKDYNDMDTHLAYAKALEAKLKGQTVQDPVLLDQCIREWLIVFRTEVGDEKGLSFHGISPLGHLYEDEDRSIPARNHIVKLTGRAPKPWETDEKFMKWVNRPVTAVAGKILSKPSIANNSISPKAAEKDGDETK